MTEKPERVWIDPPGVEPEISLEDYGQLLEATSVPPSGTYVNLMRKWRMTFMATLYIFTAIVLWVCIQLEITLETLQWIFLSVGIFFFVMATLLYKRTGETRLWK